MALTITPIPDCQQSAGPSQVEKGFQLQPGTADYPSGGYVIPGALNTSSGVGVTGTFGSQFCYGAQVMAANTAGGAYNVEFILPAGSFGTTPAPATTVTMIVTLQESASPALPLGLSAVSANSTLSAVVANVGTVTVANTLKAGQFVYLQSFTQLGALNGTIVKVASATSAAFTFNLGTAAAVTSGADTTGTFQIVQAAPGNQLQLGATATITNSLATAALLTMTSTLNPPVGSFVYIDNLTNGAKANGVIAQVLTSSTTQFTANWNGTGNTFTTAADTGNVWQLVTSGNALVTTGPSVSISNSLATASSAGTAGVITLTANNLLQPGNIVVTQGLTNGAKSNGTISAVIATGLTSALFKMNGQNGGYTTASDVGVSAVLVTGNPTTATQVSAGTDLSACYWFASFLNGGE